MTPEAVPVLVIIIALVEGETRAFADVGENDFGRFEVAIIIA